MQEKVVGGSYTLTLSQDQIIVTVLEPSDIDATISGTYVLDEDPPDVPTPPPVSLDTDAAINGELMIADEGKSALALSRDQIIVTVLEPSQSAWGDRRRCGYRWYICT